MLNISLIFFFTSYLCFFFVTKNIQIYSYSSKLYCFKSITENVNIFVFIKSKTFLLNYNGEAFSWRTVYSLVN